MKTTTIKTLFGSLLVAGALVALPTTTFAASATSTASVRIGGDGIVRVVNAEVTAISGNLISAVTNFKNTVINWTFATNASTTLALDHTGTATSTSGIHIGDKLDVTGTLGSIGSVIGVTATKVRDVTTLDLFRAKSGTVQSINTTNGTFVLKSGDKLITVQTNASTTFALGSGTTIAATTLANLPLQGYVTVVGALNADKTFMTASKVTVFLAGKKGHDKDADEKAHAKNENGKSHGLKLGWFINGKFSDR